MCECVNGRNDESVDERKDNIESNKAIIFELKSDKKPILIQAGRSGREGFSCRCKSGRDCDLSRKE